MRIRMLETVRPCFPGGTILKSGMEYEAGANKHGAVYAITATGSVGMKPGEFEFLTAPAWVLDIWKEKYPDMCSNCKIEEEPKC